MDVKLNEISNIYSGFSFKEAISFVELGNTSIVQAKNISANQEISEVENLQKIEFKNLESVSYLKYNDVLLISKATGPGNFKATVFKSTKNNVLATSSIFIIRLTNNTITPEYLALYLNSTKCQNELTILLSGSYIKSLPKKNLEATKIYLPSIEIQKNIVNLNNSLSCQKELLQKKVEINETILNSVINKLSN